MRTVDYRVTLRLLLLFISVVTALPIDLLILMISQFWFYLLGIMVFNLT
jgi:hypothetical protein